MISVSGAASSASALEAEQPHRRLVGVDEPAVGPLGGDRVGDALEDPPQVLGHEPLAELGGAQLGDVLEAHEQRGRAVGRRDGLRRRAQRPLAARGGARDHRPAERSPRAARTDGSASSASGRPSASRQRSPASTRRPAARRASSPSARAPRGWRTARPRCPARRSRPRRAARRAAPVASCVAASSTRRGLPPHRGESIDPVAPARRGLRPRTRAGSPRRGGGGPPRRGGSR